MGITPSEKTVWVVLERGEGSKCCHDKYCNLIPKTWSAMINGVFESKGAAYKWIHDDIKERLINSPWMVRCRWGWWGDSGLSENKIIGKYVKRQFRVVKETLYLGEVSCG